MNDEMYNQTLTSLWISDRLVAIIQHLEDTLRELGYEAHTTTDGDIINTHIFESGEECGSINVTRLLINIATAGQTYNYDHRLLNPSYEAYKIRRAVNDRIEVAKVVFGRGQKQELVDQLAELSKQHNLKITLVSRD